MKHVSLTAGLALALAACASNSAPSAGICLSGRMSGQYFASPNAHKTLVAGVSKIGTARCFWSEGPTAVSASNSPAWTECRTWRDTSCVVVAEGQRVTLTGYGAPAPATSSSDDRGAQFSWYLIGQFAQGLAVGLGAGIGANLVGAAFSGAAAAPQGRVEVPTREASRSFGGSTGASMCTPTGATIGGFPSYVCR